jgi:hypothetical protein
MKLFYLLFLLPALSFAQTPAYSSIEPDRCRAVEVGDEGGIWLCNGAGGFKLKLLAADVRETLTVVAPNRREFELNLWGIHSGFSLLGRTVEWRMRGGRPVALIARYNVSEDPDDSSKTTSYLMVAKVSATGACVVGEVPPNTPNQNVAARRMADRAATMSCVE